MFSIVGILLVFACVIIGFLMEKGKLAVLVQPAELITIGGAAIGTVLAANPMHILKKLLAGLTGVIKGSPFSKQRYVDTLKMMFDLFAKSRKEGAIAIESDVEEPEKSPIFSQLPGVPARSSCQRLRMRHHAHGHHRRGESVRRRPDDGP